MSDKSKIEWTDATWNPTTGCTQIPGPHGAPSGCNKCYAKVLIDTRQSANPTSVRFGTKFEEVMLHADRLEQPILWKRPRKIFVNSLSDLFHVDVPDSFVDRVMATISLAPQHTFQVLTKRPERMKRYMDELGNRYEDIERAAILMGVSLGMPDAEARFYTWLNGYSPNLWLGTSVCSNVDAWRADTLRMVAATVRFLSVEPLLGPVDQVDLKGMHWVIAGGESGPDARAANLDWVRDVRDRSVAIGAGFFFKQWGEWAPLGQCPDTMSYTEDVIAKRRELEVVGHANDAWMVRVGKKLAGRELDGRTWDEYPTVKVPA